MAVSVEAAAQRKNIVWGAPTFDQVRTGWNEMRNAAYGVATFKQSEMTAFFPGGGSVLFRSLDDPDNARSKTADGVVIDEAGDVQEAAWYEVLRPMLIDTGGWAWILGTPKGQNWFWREFVSAVDRADSMAWNAPTLGCIIQDGKLIRDSHPLENPNIPFGEMQQLFKTLPERVFRQEILAEFIEESGGVFRGVRACVDTGRTENEPPQPGRKYTLGVDLARVEDFTVLDVLDDTGRQVYHERFNQISWERQTERIRVVSALYNRCQAVLDSTGIGDPVFESCRKAGVNVVPFQFTNASKENLIDALAMKIEAGALSLMDVPAQTNELLAYQYELTPSRNVRMNAPSGMHDDCVIGLALANYAAPYVPKTPAIPPLLGAAFSPGDAPRLPQTSTPSPFL